MIASLVNKFYLFQNSRLNHRIFNESDKLLMKGFVGLFSLSSKDSNWNSIYVNWAEFYGVL